MAGYDAFISYSHSRDLAIAEALQVGLETFARPWYRPRVLRVFRDESNLSAAPGLWDEIVRALEESSWLVLMASPEAARSPWVSQEVSWWLANRSPDRLLIAWTAGTLRWDDQAGDFDWTVTDAVPEVLAGVFTGEPRWISLAGLRDVDAPLRLGDLVAEFAAPIRGLPKDALVGEHQRQRRRLRRTVAAVIAALSVLAVVAYAQRNEARTQLRHATARLLATGADAVANDRLGLAQLLAVEAVRLHDDRETRQALFRAVTASPHLVRHLPSGAPVTALAGSADQAFAVAGTADGRVLRWDVATGARTELARLPGPVLSVATSDDGSVVAATDGSAVTRWTAAGAVALPPVTAVPEPSRYDGTGRRVGLSPSGRFLAVAESSTGQERDTVVLHDASTGGRTRVRTAIPVDDLVLASERELVLAGGPGQWERRDLPDLRRTLLQDQTLMGAHGFNPTLSPGGAFFAFDTGGNLDIWRTDRPAGEPDRSGASHGTGAITAAVSRDGSRVAVVDGGTVHVAGTVTAELPGASATIPDGLEFFGDNDHLLMAAGDALIVWDLRQAARITRRARITVPAVCSGCAPPAIDVTPDGSTVVAVAGEGRAVAVRRLDGGLVADARTEEFDRTFGLLGWTADGRRLLLTRGGEVEIRDAAPGLPVVGRWPARDDGFAPIGLTADRRGVADRRKSPAAIRIRDVRTGAVRPAADPVLTVEQDGDLKSWLVATEPTGGRTRRVGTGPIAAAAAGDGRVVVQRETGALEVWDSDGATRLSALQQDPSFLMTSDKAPPAIAGDLVAQQRTDHSIVLTDVKAGEGAGSFVLPGDAPTRNTGLAFTPDAQQLISVTEDGSRDGADGLLLVWELTVERWIAVACATAGRDLTADEWRRYAGTDPPDDLSCTR